MECPLCFGIYADVQKHFVEAHPESPAKKRSKGKGDVCDDGDDPVILNEIHHRSGNTIDGQQCRYELAPSGCKYGSSCKYKHTNASSAISANASTFEGICPVCNEVFYSNVLLEIHVRAHFDSPAAASSGASAALSASVSNQSIASVDIEASEVPNVISKLRTAYATHSGPATATALLCSDGVDFYHSSRADSGWGCGYRNLQMLTSYLSKQAAFSQTLFAGVCHQQRVVPMISTIQAHIQYAWAKGFDRAGMHQMKGQLGRKWIGTPEYMSVLSSFGVKCSALEFTKADDTGKHPRLFEEVYKRFKKGGRMVAPMILQHQGHSRTIIGAEERALIVLDPSWSAKKVTDSLSSQKGLKMFRITPGRLKKPQYQVLVVDVDAGLMSPYEQSLSKTLVGTKIT